MMKRSALTALLAAVFCAACGELPASLRNTPLQDLAWERWRECNHFATVRLKEIRPDGQIWISYTSSGEFAGWQQCDREARARQKVARPLAAPPPTDLPTPAATAASSDAYARTLSDKVKFAYFTTERPAPSTIIDEALSNAPPRQQRFDTERDSRVVFLYGLVNQHKQLDVQIRWIDPSGGLVDRFHNRDDQNRSSYSWSWYTSSLSVDRMRGKPGPWKVQLLMAERLAGEYTFDLRTHERVVNVAASAERPTYRVGESWIQSDGLHEVMRVDGDRMDLRIGRSRAYRLTTSFHLERVTEGERTIAQFDPPIPSLQWPLKVGLKWDYRGTVDDGGLGVRRPIENSYEVVAFEEVVTPAGVFEAFKVVSRFATYWYSPRANYIVRYLVTAPSTVMRDFELVVFDSAPRRPTETADITPSRAIVGRMLSANDLRPYYRTSWAVVIGIDQYKSPLMPRLSFAVADARAVARALPGLGFTADKITVLENVAAAKIGIERAIYGRIAEMGPDDRLFVFFAGHGEVRTIKSGQEGYLLPFDADPENLPLTGLPMTELAQIGRRLPVKHVLFALDNCFSGYAKRRDIVTSSTISDLTALTREPVVQILTAGTEGQRAIEDGGHGIFTKHLLKGLEGWADPEGSGLTALKLATYVQERVMRDSASRQTPQYGKLEGEGEFVFRPPAR